MKKYVIIAAGGSGDRMKSNIPKQFFLLKGKPILMHTIEKFYHLNKSFKIILILPKKEVENWKKLCKKNNFNIDHEIIIGGENRFYSIKNGLKEIPNKNMILIHDGVRPLVSSRLISNLMLIGEDSKCVIPVLPIKDSIRKVKKNSSVSIDRSDLFIVQTPQCFRSEEIKKAYRQEYRSSFTDDASVYENIGGEINLISGEQQNIKITTKEDLEIVKQIYSSRE